MEREQAALIAITRTCGRCPKQESCPFGRNALESIDVMSDIQEKASSIIYIWTKHSEEALRICPTPGTITDAMKLLKA